MLNLKAASEPPLLSLRMLYYQARPSLSLDQQLCGVVYQKALHFVLFVHLDVERSEQCVDGLSDV